MTCQRSLSLLFPTIFAVLIIKGASVKQRLCFPFCILVSTLSFSFSMDQGSFSYSLFHHFLIVFAIASGDNCKKHKALKTLRQAEVLYNPDAVFLPELVSVLRSQMLKFLFLHISKDIFCHSGFIHALHSFSHVFFPIYADLIMQACSVYIFSIGTAHCLRTLYSYNSRLSTIFSHIIRIN